MSKGAVKMAIVVLSVIISVVLIVTIVSSRVNISQLDDDIADKETQIKEKENENAALQDMVDNNDLKEYAASIARDNLGFGTQSEKMYINITGK